MVPRLKKDQVYQQVRQSIVSGEYPAGMKLPREMDFAKQCQVSFITMRAALKRLEDDGLIVRLRSKGTFVCEPGEEQSQSVDKPRIALIIQEYKGSLAEEHIFNRDLIFGAVKQGYEDGFEIELYNTGKVLPHLTELCRNRRFAGVIWDRPNREHHPTIWELKSEGVPLVLINRQLDGLPSVYCDYPDAVRQVVRHLRSIGHKYILMIDMPHTQVEVFRERQEVFREQLRFGGVEKANEYVVSGECPEIEAAIRKHPEVSAVFVSYNMVGWLKECLDKHHISVPEDMSVVQWGEIAGFNRESPTPYSIMTEPRDMVGSLAVKEIKRALNDLPPPAKPLMAEGELIARRGCALPRNIKSLNTDNVLAY